MDWITDFIGDMFGTAAQILIEDWWKDPKKRMIAVSLFALTVIIILAGIVYSFS